MINPQSIPTLKECSRQLISSIRLLSVIGTASQSIIFVTEDDEVYGAGYNLNFRVGLGQFVFYTPTPRKMSSLSGKQVKYIQLCPYNGIALTKNGNVFCWGSNRLGQIGNDSHFSQRTPAIVKHLLDKHIINVKGGSFHVVALTKEGEVYCWGANHAGQIGIQSDEKIKSVPVKVKGLLARERVVQVEASANSTFALTDTGKVFAWGSNLAGDLGDGTLINRNAPVHVSGLNGKIVKISAGSNHMLAQDENGIVYTWGNNVSSQIGNGTTTNQLTPLRVSSVPIVKDILCFGNTSVFKTEDRVYACGVFPDGRTCCTPIAVNVNNMWEFAMHSYEGLCIICKPMFDSMVEIQHKLMGELQKMTYTDTIHSFVKKM